MCQRRRTPTNMRKITKYISHLPFRHPYRMLRRITAAKSNTGSCLTACSDLSSFTATPYRRQSTITNGAVGLSSSSANSTCICQCNPTQPLFREDLHICVSDLH
ncbi:hypothetical protein PV328_005099, partial [Microctonus aethiopoides]